MNTRWGAAAAAAVVVLVAGCSAGGGAPPPAPAVSSSSRAVADAEYVAAVRVVVGDAPLESDLLGARDETCVRMRGSSGDGSTAAAIRREFVEGLTNFSVGDAERVWEAAMSSCARVGWLR